MFVFMRWQQAVCRMMWDLLLPTSLLIRYPGTLQPPHVIFRGGWKFDIPVSWESKAVPLSSRDGSRVREFCHLDLELILQPDSLVAYEARTRMEVSCKRRNNVFWLRLVEMSGMAMACSRPPGDIRMAVVVGERFHHTIDRFRNRRQV